MLAGQRQQLQRTCGSVPRTITGSPQGRGRPRASDAAEGFQLVREVVCGLVAR
jgi:hypothetical protein